MSGQRILIAGIGNVFFGDDGFGVEVAQRLAARSLPAQVRVGDFGIRGYDLAYALLDGYDAVIMVDATARGEPAGSLCVIEPECDGSAAASLDAHTMNPVQVLRFAQSLGGPLPRMLLVGCEPVPFASDDMQMGLSDAVEGAVGEAIVLIESLVERLLAEEAELWETGQSDGESAGGKERDHDQLAVNFASSDASRPVHPPERNHANED